MSESWQPGLDEVPDNSGTGADGDGQADQVFSQTYSALPESVAAIRAAVADFATHAGASGATVDAVKLAVSEAATNVVVHAYRATTEPGSIHVEAARAGGELRVSVADTGRGLRSGGKSPGLGLGLAIIGELANGVELLQGGNGGLRVLMRFAVPASPTPA